MPMHVPLTRHIYVHQFNHISNLSSAFTEDIYIFTSDSKQQWWEDNIKSNLLFRDIHQLQEKNLRQNRQI